MGSRTLVIGGSGGIGGGIVDAMVAEPGSRVMIADRVAPERLADGCSYQHVDVTSRASVDSLFSEVSRCWDALDAMVYAPAIGVTKPFLDVTEDDWDAIMAVNLTGAFLCCTKAGRMMAEAGHGSIVVLSSVAAQRPSEQTSPYTATKAALELFVQGLAMELGPCGIRANIIAPGPVETALTARLHTGDRRALYTARIALGRYGLPREIGGVVAFVASPLARFVTGQVIYVDGGMSIANMLPTHDAGEP